MKKIIIAAISLDGKIAKSTNDKLDWTGKDDKKWFVEVTKKAKVIIMGHNSYQVFNSPLKDRLTKVMTLSTIGKQDIPNQVEFTNQKPSALIKELSNRGFKTVFIGGGAAINTLFLQNNLVDEIWLSIIPTIIGPGIGLFQENINIPQKFQLITTKKLGQNGLILKYKLLAV